MTAAAFAGMPVTAVIARSSLNIKLKAHSRLPALVQSAFVFGSLALYSDVISTVPVSALAGAPPSRAQSTPHHSHPTFPAGRPFTPRQPVPTGVLISSGAAMLKPHELESCLAEDKYNIAPYLVTTGGMLTMGMAEGILLGCATSAAKYGVRHLILHAKERPLPEAQKPKEG